MSGPPEETYRLGDERDRLDSRLDDLAERLADADPATASAQVVREIANEVDQRGEGVAHLIHEHGEDAEVTVRGLRAGEYARVQDRVATMQAQKDGPGGVPGSHANTFAAAGLVDAPFLDDDHDGGLDETVVAVAQQPVGVAKWLEGRTNDLTTRGTEGNWRGLEDRLADHESETEN